MWLRTSRRFRRRRTKETVLTSTAIAASAPATTESNASLRRSVTGASLAPGGARAQQEEGDVVAQGAAVGLLGVGDEPVDEIVDPVGCLQVRGGQPAQAGVVEPGAPLASVAALDDAVGVGEQAPVGAE